MGDAARGCGSLQLYEMIVVRHGLMVVGYSFGSKSSMWRVLTDALSDLGRASLPAAAPEKVSRQKSRLA